MKASKPPVVLVFAGSDPSGGAGIQADIQSLTALGCHPAPVVTAVTAQDTTGIKQFTVVETEMVIAQARTVLEDMPVAAFKTGMLGNSTNLSAIASIVADYPDIPLVVDPVMATGSGDALTEDALEDPYRVLLVPRAKLLTPNCIEARLLTSGADSPEARAQELMSLGSDYVLITGTHDPTPQVIHRLYGNRRCLESFTQERLPGEYHGSGCTLAAACAAGIAQGFDPVSAVSEALKYTWNSLKHGYRLGMGQNLPDRQYWVNPWPTPRKKK